MIGVTPLRGTPLPPWHVLQTSSLAPRMASASAVFPGEATGGTSGICAGAAIAPLKAAVASAARTTRTPNTVGKRLLIILRCPCSSTRDSHHATNALEPL